MVASPQHRLMLGTRLIEEASGGARADPAGVPGPAVRLFRDPDAAPDGAGLVGPDLDAGDRRLRADHAHGLGGPAEVGTAARRVTTRWARRPRVTGSRRRP